MELLDWVAWVGQIQSIEPIRTQRGKCDNKIVRKMRCEKYSNYCYWICRGRKWAMNQGMCATSKSGKIKKTIL
jgi:hypothetical protein